MYGIRTWISLVTLPCFFSNGLPLRWVFLFLCFRHLTVFVKVLCFRAVCPPRSSISLFICPSRHIVTTIHHESLDETDREHSPVPADDLIVFWRSKVDVTAGCRGEKGVHTSTGHQSPFSGYMNYYPHRHNHYLHFTSRFSGECGLISPPCSCACCWRETSA